MKKSLAIVAAVLAAGCAVGLTGCGGNKKNAAALSSNWYAVTTNSEFQPTLAGVEKAEKIVYKVTYEALSTPNAYYSANYSDGTYTTEFYTTAFKASDFDFGDYSEGYPQSITAYCYHTVLSLPSVIYEIKATEEKSEAFADSIETFSYFLSVKNNLMPLYSEQTVKSTSPAKFQAGKVDETFRHIDRVYKNYYMYDGSAVKTVATVNEADYEYADLKEKTFTVENKKLADSAYSVFDTSAVNIVSRATNLSAGSTLTQTISQYIPSAGNYQNFTLVCADTALGTDEEKTNALKTELEAKLAEKGLYKETKDAEGNKIGLKTVAVSLNSTDNSTVQTCWFTAVDNKNNNTGRATMVKLSVPLAYSLGTLNYTLDTIEQTFWNE